MALRRQTLYGFADSPVALAARMLDHDARSYEDITYAFEGHPVGDLTRDEDLDNIKSVSGPASVSVFPRELFTAEVRAAFRSLRTNGGTHE